MRLLIGLITPGQAGGIYVTEEKFVEECRRKGLVVTLFEYGGRGSSETMYQKIAGRMTDWMRFQHLMRREQPDLVFLNSAFTYHAVLRDAGYVALARRAGTRIFIKMHGTNVYHLENTTPGWSQLVRFVVGKAHGIGLLSEEERQNFLRSGFRGDNLFVVKNAVDAQRFMRDDRASAGRGPSLRLLFIARFIPAKGLLDVLEAVRLVVDRGKDVCLTCVGDGPQGEEARRRAEALGIAAKVTFTGYIPEAETVQHYRSADVLVFPTYHQEGFPMAVFQSAAAGLGIITTQARASADHLREPGNCLWVEPKNPRMLAEKIIFLIDHPDALAAMARNNRVLAAGLGTETVTEEYLRIFTALTETRGR
jgi:glycosyltransferase involved in cell wall biosynthesis